MSSVHVSPLSTYIGIFSALMVLTAITVGVAFINLGALNPIVALGVAAIKATLVILFFMHVKYSSRLTKLIIGTGFFFLVVLFVLTMTDYLSRGWLTYPVDAGSPSLSGDPTANSQSGWAKWSVIFRRAASSAASSTLG